METRPAVFKKFGAVSRQHLRGVQLEPEPAEETDCGHPLPHAVEARIDVDAISRWRGCCRARAATLTCKGRALLSHSILHSRNTLWSWAFRCTTSWPPDSLSHSSLWSWTTSQFQMGHSGGSQGTPDPQSELFQVFCQGMHAAVVGSVWAILLATLKLDPSWGTASVAASHAKAWRRLPPRIPELKPTVRFEADVVED